jgi:hypothetical protein
MKVVSLRFPQSGVLLGSVVFIAKFFSLFYPVSSIPMMLISSKTAY